MDGSAWAASPARTLARRLQRRHRDEIGPSRGQALSWRMNALRTASSVHWKLDDAIGRHHGAFRDSIEAAKLLRLFDPSALVEAVELRGIANWAKHAAPPGGRAPVAMAAGIAALDLEAFRHSLHVDEQFSSQVASGGQQRTGGATLGPPGAWNDAGNNVGGVPLLVCEKLCEGVLGIDLTSSMLEDAWLLGRSSPPGCTAAERGAMPATHTGTPVDDNGDESGSAATPMRSIVEASARDGVVAAPTDVVSLGLLGNWRCRSGCRLEPPGQRPGGSKGDSGRN